jgi:hypothetical protein
MSKSPNYIRYSPPVPLQDQTQIYRRDTFIAYLPTTGSPVACLTAPFTSNFSSCSNLCRLAASLPATPPSGSAGLLPTLSPRIRSCSTLFAPKLRRQVIRLPKTRMTRPTRTPNRTSMRTSLRTLHTHPLTLNSIRNIPLSRLLFYTVF